MKRFIQGQDRSQSTLFPESLEEYISEGNTVRVKVLEKEIFKTARKDPCVKLLETIPGIGIVNASAIVATIGSGEQFKTGRDFAAWVGLTPLNKSSASIVSTDFGCALTVDDFA